MKSNHKDELVDIQVGELVETSDGDIGIVIALYPIFELGVVDYYVQINGSIEIYHADELKPIEL